MTGLGDEMWADSFSAQLYEHHLLLISVILMTMTLMSWGSAQDITNSHIGINLSKLFIIIDATYRKLKMRCYFTKNTIRNILNSLKDVCRPNYVDISNYANSIRKHYIHKSPRNEIFSRTNGLMERFLKFNPGNYFSFIEKTSGWHVG